MDPITQQGLAGSAGAGGDPLYVDDVFSTFLYRGTKPSSQTINNGIDLSGEGGMVWIKQRNGTREHHVFDTERGATKYLNTRSSNQEATGTQTLTSFTSSGFSLGDDTNVNHQEDFVSWSFRKAPGFFDIVTYTGNGSNRTIAHNLGSVPGMIMIKMLNDGDSWQVYHRSLGATHYLRLNSDNQAIDNDNRFNDTEPTASVFTVGTDNGVNQSGKTFVAYVFAHDDQSFGTDSDEAIIKCGSFTTDSSGVFTEVNLGWEPQLLLIKRSDSSTAGTWILLDNMRGLGAGESRFLYPNETNAEASNSVGFVHLTSTGFKGASSTQQQANATYIYMAIRRPHKPPTVATEVFAIDTLGGTSPTPPGFSSGFPVDMAWWVLTTSSSGGVYANTRLQGAKDLVTYSTIPEDPQTNRKFDYQNGFLDASSTNSNYLCWMFRRAPGFLDVVAYTGTGSAQNINHNLGGVPEIMMVKNREDYYNWRTYDSINGSTKSMFLNSTPASAASTSVWNNTAPTATQFTVGSSAETNRSGDGYIAYLFASLDGISKVGSYSGTGSNIDVDCGFTAGARFVLIKRTDWGSDWYVWDTQRGIVSGNDPYLILNPPSTPQVTNTDYIDPLNAGFTVTSSAPAALNTSGGTYLFLAIA